MEEPLNQNMQEPLSADPVPQPQHAEKKRQPLPPYRLKNMLLIIFAIVAVGCLVYIPGMNDLGLYRDDWNNYYNAVIRGPEMMVDHYSSDRPADGWLIGMLFRLFGTNNTAYLTWNLVCRIAGAVFLALTLLIVWPATPKMAGAAGLLAVVFPGFLEQVDGIAYIPHQTAMFCFLFSLWLTAMACEPHRVRPRYVLTFVSILFSFASMLLMEYYMGMEIFRLGLIYMLNRELWKDGKLKAFFRSLLYYLPYLLPALGFVIWRSFFFTAERAGADVVSEVIRPILDHPRDQIGSLLCRLAKSVWKLFAGAWTIPAYNLINGLDKKSFWKTLLSSAVIFAVAQGFLFLLHRRRTEASLRDADNECFQWLWFGLICGSLAISPLVLAGRDINYSSSLDRFSWPGMIGSILFLLGLLGSLRDRTLRNLLTMTALLLSIFVQRQNQQNHIRTWKETQEFWQQLMWRAPGLKSGILLEEKSGTTLVTAGAFSAEEDYEIFAPASMIYYSDEKNWAPVGAEVLTNNTVREIEMGKRTDRTVRDIYTVKDYQQLLALSKPNQQSCLHVIDGKNPIYSTSEWSKIPQVGAYSNLDQIELNPEKPAVRPFFLGEEPEHGWCYYYESMELALQQGETEAAAKLADEAAAKSLRAEDSVEWIPVIEAYVESGRTEDALPYVSILKDNEYMAFSACRYFGNKENTADYAEFMAALCEEE